MLTTFLQMKFLQQALNYLNELLQILYETKKIEIIVIFWNYSCTFTWNFLSTIFTNTTKKIESLKKKEYHNNHMKTSKLSSAKNFIVFQNSTKKLHLFSHKIVYQHNFTIWLANSIKFGSPKVYKKYHLCCTKDKIYLYTKNRNKTEWKIKYFKLFYVWVIDKCTPIRIFESVNIAEKQSNEIQFSRNSPQYLQSTATVVLLSLTSKSKKKKKKTLWMREIFPKEIKWKVRFDRPPPYPHPLQRPAS